MNLNKPLLNLQDQIIACCPGAAASLSETNEASSE